MANTPGAQRSDPLTGFIRLRSMVRSAAKDVLVQLCPEYVDTFQSELTKSSDFDHASRAAAPLLGEGLPDQWKGILSLTVNFELALDQCKRSLSLMKQFLRAGLSAHG